MQRGRLNSVSTYVQYIHHTVQVCNVVETKSVGVFHKKNKMPATLSSSFCYTVWCDLTSLGNNIGNLEEAKVKSTCQTGEAINILLTELHTYDTWYYGITSHLLMWCTQSVSHWFGRLMTLSVRSLCTTVSNRELKWHFGKEFADRESSTPTKLPENLNKK